MGCPSLSPNNAENAHNAGTETAVRCETAVIEDADGPPCSRLQLIENTLFIKGSVKFSGSSIPLQPLLLPESEKFCFVLGGITSHKLPKSLLRTSSRCPGTERQHSTFSSRGILLECLLQILSFGNNMALIRHKRGVAMVGILAWLWLCCLLLRVTLGHWGRKHRLVNGLWAPLSNQGTGQLTSPLSIGLLGLLQIP